MKKIVMGGYTGRENRGTEAIAKSVSAMFRKLNVKTSLTVRSENEFKENQDFIDGMQLLKESEGGRCLWGGDLFDGL